MKKTALFALAISTMLLAVSCGKNGKEAETAADTGRQDSISQAAQIADKAKQDSLQRLDSIKNIVTPDMAIFDVKGPVKRISWGGGCVADFDAHGKLTSMKYKRTKYSIKRNHEGYITLCDAWYQEGQRLEARLEAATPTTISIAWHHLPPSLAPMDLGVE